MEERPDALVGEEYPGVGVGSATAAELDRHKALSEEAKKVYNDLQFGMLNIIFVSHVQIQRGDRGFGSPAPLENYKNLGFLSNTGLDPLKITKLPMQHSMLGHHLPASKRPFKWRFAGGTLMAR